ncbi:phosphatase PAP2 family protein [Kroppenstedtia guangzhouensis]|jgi:undecaprenyl-diphosphatase|uniref:Phosphatase PAP2 family protein n=1 Tax=Kroppenstedtia guangzhouensis TaxID=1274356 RepID=A0ABQ1FVT6_9BACL|nr:phosphatase PAP2 family protein [Kroppenstedtia guangzhouensis]GGA32167.1 phosphatase PAP2 family protein [Kroppenstedtia guangzhouensis]
MKRLAARLQNVDHRFVFYVNRQWKCRFMDWLMSRVTHVGGAGFTLSFLLAWFALPVSPIRYWALEGLVSLVSSHLAVRMGKHCWQRLRPYLQHSDLRMVSSPLNDYSFPSGHTAAAFSLALIWIFHVPWLSVLLFPLAMAVGLSRIYLGLHYPTDVVVGAWLGTIFAMGTHYLFEWLAT